MSKATKGRHARYHKDKKLRMLRLRDQARQREGAQRELQNLNAGGSVCGCVCVYMHTHTHTAQMGYLDVRPGVGIRHLEGPTNLDALNLGIHIFVYVYKVHMCIYMLRGGMRSWTNCFFLLTCLFF